MHFIDSNARLRAMLRRRSALVVLVLAVAGCASVRLIGDYDDTLDKGVTDLHQRAELYIAKLESTPTTPMDQAFFDSANASLAVLRSRAASLPKYGTIVDMIDNLKAQFDDFNKLDKLTTRPVPNATVTAAESAITVSVESILKLELALKRGDDPAAASGSASKKP